MYTYILYHPLHTGDVWHRVPVCATLEVKCVGAALMMQFENSGSIYFSAFLLCMKNTFIEKSHIGKDES